jgi:hypothetical protein
MYVVIVSLSFLLFVLWCCCVLFCCTVYCMQEHTQHCQRSWRSRYTSIYRKSYWESGYTFVPFFYLYLHITLSNYVESEVSSTLSVHSSTLRESWSYFWFYKTYWRKSWFTNVMIDVGHCPAPVRHKWMIMGVGFWLFGLSIITLVPWIPVLAVLDYSDHFYFW